MAQQYPYRSKYGTMNPPMTDDEDHALAKALEATSQAEKLRAQGGFNIPENPQSTWVSASTGGKGGSPGGGGSVGPWMPNISPGVSPGILPQPWPPLPTGPGYPLPFPMAPGVEEGAILMTRPMVNVDVLSENSARLEIENIPNEQAMRIVKDVLPKALALYLNKSKDYGGNVGDLAKLGPKSMFVDIWRKVGKLKRSLWDGAPLVGEQNEEIIQDLIGHCLIILDDLQGEPE